MNDKPIPGGENQAIALRIVNANSHQEAYYEAMTSAKQTYEGHDIRFHVMCEIDDDIKGSK